MKIEIEKLVKACGKNTRKIIQLDDIIENLNAEKIISIEDFIKLQEEFYDSIVKIYGLKFFDAVIDIFNSELYVENL